MDIDFKITAWERVVVPEHLEDKVLEKIKDGSLRTANEVCIYLANLDIYGKYEGILEDTIISMSIEENNGNPTIEVIGDEGEYIFNNVIK